MAYNTEITLIDFFSTDERPVTFSEFRQFWKSLSPQEQKFYRSLVKF